jgi:hypothetical protein
LDWAIRGNWRNINRVPFGSARRLSRANFGLEIAGGPELLRSMSYHEDLVPPVVKDVRHLIQFQESVIEPAGSVVTLVLFWILLLDLFEGDLGFIGRRIYYLGEDGDRKIDAGLTDFVSGCVGIYLLGGLSQAKHHGRAVGLLTKGLGLGYPISHKRLSVHSNIDDEGVVKKDEPRWFCLPDGNGHVNLCGQVYGNFACWKFNGQEKESAGETLGRWAFRRPKAFWKRPVGANKSKQ